MGARTGAQVLAGLKDGRQLYMDGELVSDVTTDRRLAGGARTIAELYDLQLRPDLVEEMTYASPLTGDRVGLSFIEPRSLEDLRRRRVMIKHWHDHTLGMFGRAPDFLNVLISAFASASEAFGPVYGKNMRAYYERVRENDVVSTHTLTNPQVDRTKNVAAQAKDLAAKAVKDNDKGIVIHGARMLATLAAYSDDLLVMPAPSYPLADSDEAKPFAIGFAIPVATQGIRLIARPSIMHLGAGSPLDHPLSTRFDESDCMVIFDNVLVPWENVFVYRDVEIFNSLYRRSNALGAMAHQFSIKDLAKAEFMMALAFALVKTTKIDEFQHIQGLLAELINHTEIIRSCVLAAEAGASLNAFGVMIPAGGPLGAVRFVFPDMFRRACEAIQIMGAGGLFMVPSFAEVDGPLAEDVKSYYQAAGANSRTRIQLFRLAYDTALSSFSGRQILYERYFAGDLVRAAGGLYHGYNKEPGLKHIADVLERFANDAAADAVKGK